MFAPPALHAVFTEIGYILRAMAPVPTISAVAGIGLVLGFRHAFEPDHLAAVSTLATRHGSLRTACGLGLAWALGHTASVGVVVAAIIVAGLRLPDAIWPAADFLVGVLLVALGSSVIYRYVRGRWHLHAHTHSSGGEGATHVHLHSHAHEHSHLHTHGRPDARRSLGFGLLHGLAGSAAILVLLVAAAPTRGAQIAYFIAFGVGTVLGMLSVSLALASAIRLATARGARWASWLHLGSAGASILVGLVLAMRTSGLLD
jgi:ABC-type nickel/cobalt efflux system permease component RcnA